MDSELVPDINGSRAAPAPDGAPTHIVRLPGFIVDHEVGLGDVIKRATTAVGIKPCGGCQQRAVALNRWLTFGQGRPGSRLR